LSRGEPRAFDWIVIGDDPGALLSGAMAARLGLSVLILPQSGRPAPYAAP
jgi:phytoene dehydrogenase-like protein